MKKLLALAALFYGSSLFPIPLFNSPTPLDQFESFMSDSLFDAKMEWLDLMLMKFNKKIELKKKHMKEWKQFIKDHVKLIKDTDPITQADKDRIAHERLAKGINLRRQQMQEWRNFSADMEKKKADLANEQENRLKDFADYEKPAIAVNN